MLQSKGLQRVGHDWATEEWQQSRLRAETGAPRPRGRHCPVLHREASFGARQNWILPVAGQVFTEPPVCGPGDCVANGTDMGSVALEPAARRERR